MQRNLKKQQKRLKREAKKKENQRPPNRWWAAIYCTHENMFIGISYAKIKIPFGQRYKVDAKDWLPFCCSFKTIQHVINLTQYSKGQQVVCPKCNHPVDFRLWRSSTKPELTEVEYDNENCVAQLPNTQTP